MVIRPRVKRSQRSQLRSVSVAQWVRCRLNIITPPLRCSSLRLLDLHRYFNLSSSPCQPCQLTLSLGRSSGSSRLNSSTRFHLLSPLFPPRRSLLRIRLTSLDLDPWPCMERRTLLRINGICPTQRLRLTRASLHRRMSCIPALPLQSRTDRPRWVTRLERRPSSSLSSISLACSNSRRRPHLIYLRPSITLRLHLLQ